LDRTERRAIFIIASP